MTVQYKPTEHNGYLSSFSDIFYAVVKMAGVKMLDCNM